ncbi:MAG: chemotaxis-specific protein-glutamate methyltransferase CheB [Roseobacter sp.]|nr:chemotaxis-specific protein-glutamate methyltransferase CheB [Roseobacter sp.]
MDATSLTGRQKGTAKRVLIVDDSRAIRDWLRTVLISDPRLEIVGEASNAVEARDFLRAHPADVVTLDIEMPGMSGLEFLTRLMRARPMPVVMLSSLTSKGSDAAIQALSRGAIDCILKPSEGSNKFLRRDICERVFNAASSKPLRRATGLQSSLHSMHRAAAPRQSPERQCRRGALILIGASTGGVTAIESLLQQLDRHGPPVVIVQHMPGHFLQSFSDRLNRYLPQTVGLAAEGQILRRGDVVLAPGIGKHTTVVRDAEGWTCRFITGDVDALHCPSVDTLFLSAISEAKNIAAVILTGLGRDGAEGLLKLSQAGAATFGQDEDTCVVYGMPRAAYELGAVRHQLPLEKIGDAVRQQFLVKQNRPKEPSHGG